MMNIKVLITTLVVILGMGTRSVHGTVTTFSGSIRENTTWSDTMRLWGDVIVRDGAVLTIAPGTHVQFADTNRFAIFGTPDGIHLLGLLTGGIQAFGSENEPIVFERDNAFVRDGGWGKIQLIANDGLSSFRYCRFDHATTALYAQNTGGYSGTTNLDARDCSFNRCGTAVFVGSGASVSFRDSRIDSCDYGFSSYGASDIDLQYLEMADNMSGIVVSGHPDFVTSGSINHVTIYNTSVMPINGSPVSWWHGYGISFANTAYPDFEIKNSIISESHIANLNTQQWTINEHHNCWFQGDSAVNVEGDPIGPSSITDDPLFDDLANRLFSLDQMMSPCLYAADDGTHMGAWWEDVHTEISAGTVDGIPSGSGENPADSHIRLCPDGTSVAYTLFDVRGVRVLAGRTDGRGLIDVSGVRDGAYLLKTGDDGEFSYRRFVVRH